MVRCEFVKMALFGRVSDVDCEILVKTEFSDAQRMRKSFRDFQALAASLANLLSDPAQVRTCLMRYLSPCSVLLSLFFFFFFLLLFLVPKKN